MNQNLTIFKQLGFTLQKEGMTQYAGKCLFCGKDEHFAINKKTFQWDCKHCGRAGGTSMLLEQVAKFGVEHFKLNVAIKLSKYRGIQINILRKHKMGYLPVLGKYILPVCDFTGKNIINIRVYNWGKKLLGLTNKNVCLYGWEHLDNKKGLVWICEGHWDVMAFSEMLNNEKDCILAVPGADIFKSDWLMLLKDRRVNILYHNDEAGNRGSVKLYNLLKSKVNSMKFIHWNPSLKTGYDINDALVDNLNIDYVIKHLKDKPPSATDIEVKEKEFDPEDILDGRRVQYDMVYKVYQKWLHLKNTDVIDVLYGAVIANRMEGDPVWLFLVAPPGGTKTELIMSLADAPKMFSMSTLTSNTLISGFGGTGVDPSYIPRFNEKVVIVKDFTVILSMNQTAREEIFSILRDAYDGECAKPFGNNIYRCYISKFGLIAGVTPIIEQFAAVHASVGERFLRYVIPMDVSLKGSRKYLEKAMANISFEKKMKDQLRKIAVDVLSFNYTVIPEIPDAIKNKIMMLAQFISTVRGTVTRDRYSKEITHKPFWELPTRVTKVITKLALGIGQFKNQKKIGHTEYNIIKEIAKSSIPNNLESVVRCLQKEGEDKVYTSNEISEMIRMPRITCGRILENLHMLDVLKRIEAGRGSGKFRWKFTDDIMEILEVSEIYK